MKLFFEARKKTNCTNCEYSRQIPLSNHVTCKHPMAQVQRNFDAGAHGLAYWPVSFDPKSLATCPCRGFREMKKAA